MVCAVWFAVCDMQVCSLRSLLIGQIFVLRVVPADSEASQLAWVGWPVLDLPPYHDGVQDCYCDDLCAAHPGEDARV